MALFKIFRGPENGLNTIPCHDGYAYFTEDQGNLYIDIGNNAGDRVQVNAYYAQALRNIKSDGSIEYIEFDDIELKDAIKDVAHGGTGRNTLTAGAVLVGDGTNAMKMTIINENEILAGDPTNGVKGINGVGVMLRLTGEAPKFADALPITLGGTGGKTAGAARTNLDVYSKSEVDIKVGEVTEKAYTTTLLTTGWLAQDGEFVYDYANTNIKCGKAGDVPPTITYTSNLDEYSKIEKAECTVGTGIRFTSKTKPTADIGIIVIDKG